MNSISCEGLQYYWVTCDERNHQSASKYTFPKILNWYNQFKCSKKNIENGRKLSLLSSNFQNFHLKGTAMPLTVVRSESRANNYRRYSTAFLRNALNLVDSNEWIIFVWQLCDWAVSVCGRLKYVWMQQESYTNSFNAKIFVRTKFYLGSLVSEGTPPELGGICLGDAEVVALKEATGEDGL